MSPLSLHSSIRKIEQHKASLHRAIRDENWQVCEEELQRLSSECSAAAQIALEIKMRNRCPERVA